MISSPLRRKTKKKNKRKVKKIENINVIDPEENTNYNYFGKDFARTKDQNIVESLQSNYNLFLCS